MRLLTPAWLSGLALAACTGDGVGPEGALERALALARPVTPSAMGAVASTTWEAPVPLPELTAHTLEVKAELALTSGTSVQKLLIERRIARQQRRFRVFERRVHETPSAADPTRSISYSESFEAVFDGERLALRRGEGPWIERDAREGLPARILARLHDLAPFLLGALGDYLVPTPLAEGPDAPAALSGIRVAWHRLGLDRGVAPRSLTADELRALRDHDERVGAWLAASFQPTRVEGRLASIERAATAGGTASRPGPGRPDPTASLDLELALSGPAKLDGGAAAALSVTLSQRVSGLGAVDFTLPAERLPESRERPWKMIEDVLGDDLLPPYAPR